MPSNFLASCGVQLQTNVGDNLQRSVANLGVNAKIDIDEVIAAGLYDLAPLLASVTKPRMLQIVLADASGAKINIDGVGVPASLKARTIFLEIVSDVAPDIELTLTVLQRVQVLCVGEE